MTPPPSLREVAEALLGIARQYANECGPCDHAADICVCGIGYEIGRAEAALAAKPEPPRAAYDAARKALVEASESWSERDEQIARAMWNAGVSLGFRPTPDPRGDVAGLASECEQAALVADSEYDADLLRAAAAEIERLRADAGWVRVEDVLPERDREDRLGTDFVLTWNGYYIAEGWYDHGRNGGWKLIGPEGLPMDGVTHWRPLPPAPERGA